LDTKGRRGWLDEHPIASGALAKENLSRTEGERGPERKIRRCPCRDEAREDWYGIIPGGKKGTEVEKGPNRTLARPEEKVLEELFMPGMKGVPITIPMTSQLRQTKNLREKRRPLGDALCSKYYGWIKKESMKRRERKVPVKKESFIYWDEDCPEKGDWKQKDKP